MVNFFGEINSCDALRIMDGICDLEKDKERRQNLAREKFSAIDNDRELERRILLYEMNRNFNDLFELVKSLKCYVCETNFIAKGRQNQYGICDECLDVWDDDQLFLRRK
jgi:hypothetical protein